MFTRGVGLATPDNIAMLCMGMPILHYNVVTWTPRPCPLEGDLRPTSGFRPILVIADFSPRVPSVGPSFPRAARAIAPHAATSRLER